MVPSAKNPEILEMKVEVDFLEGSKASKTSTIYIKKVDIKENRMDRNEMMSFEEMEKKEGDVATDYETICYKIEKVIHDMMETDGKVDALLLSYAVDDILWDCYQAECVSSGLGLIYYNKENHMNYEIIFDDGPTGIEEINIWEDEGDVDEDYEDDDEY